MGQAHHAGAVRRVADDSRARHRPRRQHPQIVRVVAGELREWGGVTAEELTRILVLSPHLDDAVLGCGHLLAAHSGSTVLTVFAGAPDTYPESMTWWDQMAGFSRGDDPLVARRREDADALDELGAKPIWLDFVEHQYLDRDDWVRPAAIVLRERLPGPAWFCYEDTGYKHIPGLLAWRVARLFRSGVWPTPVVMPVAVDAGVKHAALSHYRSQLQALEADWQLSTKQPERDPGQYWRLASPPEGWEGLIEL